MVVFKIWYSTGTSYSSEPLLSISIICAKEQVNTYDTLKAKSLIQRLVPAIFFFHLNIY